MMSPEEVLYQVGNNAAKAWEALHSGHRWTPEQAEWLRSVAGAGTAVAAQGATAAPRPVPAAASTNAPADDAAPAGPVETSTGFVDNEDTRVVPHFPRPVAGAVQPAPVTASVNAPVGGTSPDRMRPQAASPATPAPLSSPEGYEEAPAWPVGGATAGSEARSAPSVAAGSAGAWKQQPPRRRPLLRWVLIVLGLLAVVAVALACGFWLFAGGSQPQDTPKDAGAQAAPEATGEATAPAVQAPAPPAVLRAGFGSYICSSKGQGVQCWGARKTGEKVPLAPVAGLEDVKVVALSVGRGFATAVAEDGTVYAWGVNDVGQLGAGEAAGSESALTVGTLPGTPKQLVSGTEHTCALVADEVYCFGSNRYGQVDGTTSNGPTGVTQVPGVSGVVQIGTSGYDSWAATADGIWSWGNNNWGQVTDGAEKVVPPTFTADR